MSRERLPAWTPLVIAGAALIASPVLFALPRPAVPGVGGATVDDFMEALPFVIAGAALLLIPFTVPGRLRTIGAVMAALLALAPVWAPVTIMAVDDFTAEPPHATLHLTVTPESDGPYELVVPLGDGSGDVSGLEAILPRQVELATMEDGRPALVVTADGPLHWTRTVQPYDGPAGFGDADRADPVLRQGNTTVAFSFSLVVDYNAACRWSESFVAGAAHPDGTGHARSSIMTTVC